MRETEKAPYQLYVKMHTYNIKIELSVVRQYARTRSYYTSKCRIYARNYNYYTASVREYVSKSTGVPLHEVSSNPSVYVPLVLMRNNDVPLYTLAVSEVMLLGILLS